VVTGIPKTLLPTEWLGYSHTYTLMHPHTEAAAEKDE